MKNRIFKKVKKNSYLINFLFTEESDKLNDYYHKRIGNKVGKSNSSYAPDA